MKYWIIEYYHPWLGCNQVSLPIIASSWEEAQFDVRYAMGKFGWCFPIVGGREVGHNA